MRRLGVRGETDNIYLVHPDAAGVEPASVLADPYSQTALIDDALKPVTS
jgi:hypothetical protein